MIRRFPLVNETFATICRAAGHSVTYRSEPSESRLVLLTPSRVTWVIPVTLGCTTSGLSALKAANVKNSKETVCIETNRQLVLFCPLNMRGWYQVRVLSLQEI